MQVRPARLLPHQQRDRRRHRLPERGAEPEHRLRRVRQAATPASTCPQGVSVIKGSQALAFVRQRHGLPDGDLDRIMRQQYFLSAAFHKVDLSRRAAQPVQAARPARARSARRCSPTRRWTWSRSAQQFEAIVGGQHHLPDDPQQRPADDLPGRRRDVDRPGRQGRDAGLRPAAARASPPTRALKPGRRRSPSSVTVDVLNGTRRAAAGRAATRPALQALGFKVEHRRLDRRDGHDHDRVPSGRRGAGQGRRERRAGRALVETSTVTRVTLILGNNGIQVAGLATATPTATTPPRDAGSTSRDGPSGLHELDCRARPA